MSIELADLPYNEDALEPFLSRDTLAVHYGKHHKGYVDKLNKFIKGTQYEDRNLQDMIVQARADGNTAVYNNAAQTLNHSFLWDSMSPDGGGEPSGPVREAIDAAFGDLKGFQKEFRDKALNQFGSGWTWLVYNGNKLEIVSTSNADTPIVDGLRPLLTLDVWEHAYYLDYKNERGRYVDAYLSDCINWTFAAENLKTVPAAA